MNKRAFTLVELLITIVVSALVINGVIMSLINSMVLNEYNQEFSIAMNIARAKIESIISRKANFSTITNEGVSPLPPGILTVAADGINGLYRIDVTDINPQLKNVKVTVCWQARGNRIIGDCNPPPAGSSTLSWKAPYGSPCSIETAVAQR